jgi:hypothetical protein
MGKGPTVTEGGLGLKSYYKGKIEELEMLIKDKSHNLRRLEAQRNELNTQGELFITPTCNIQASGAPMQQAESAKQCTYHAVHPLSAVTVCA